MISYPIPETSIHLSLFGPVFQFFFSYLVESGFFSPSTQPRQLIGCQPRNRISSGFVYKLSGKLRNLLTQPQREMNE